jgi:hypothetical protein
MTWSVDKNCHSLDGWYLLRTKVSAVAIAALKRPNFFIMTLEEAKDFILLNKI